MLDSVKVKDFQSIADAEVELGKFTVLAGRSSSGKSAFVRAVRALIRNSFVPSNVRHGKTKTVVSLQCDGVEVTATRGKSISSYSLGQEQYTKTGKTVPEDVAAHLSMGLVSDQDTNFNFQFDKPFLLDSPGSKVATVLGSLTNIHALHAAVKESNRRKLGVEADVKATAKLLETSQGELQQFSDLPQQEDELKALEAAVERLESTQVIRDALKGVISGITGTAEQIKSVERVIVPEANWNALEEYSTLHAALSDIKKTHRLVTELTEKLTGVRGQIQEIEQEYDTLEITCPECGQPIPSGD